MRRKQNVTEEIKKRRENNGIGGRIEDRTERKRRDRRGAERK